MNTAKSRPMLQGRQADSLRRRQRVTAALDRAAAEGTEISASGIARATGVDRTFIYRHRDLLEKIRALQTEPPADDGTDPAVTQASLQTDLLAAHERAIRLSTRIHHLEKRPFEALGDQAWRESGLGAPPTSTPQPEDHSPGTAGSISGQPLHRPGRRDKGRLSSA